MSRQGTWLQFSLNLMEHTWFLLKTEQKHNICFTEQMINIPYNTISRMVLAPEKSQKHVAGLWLEEVKRSCIALPTRRQQRRRRSTNSGASCCLQPFGSLQRRLLPQVGMRGRRDPQSHPQGRGDSLEHHQPSPTSAGRGQGGKKQWHCLQRLLPSGPPEQFTCRSVKGASAWASAAGASEEKPGLPTASSKRFCLAPQAPEYQQN